MLQENLHTGAGPVTPSTQGFPSNTQDRTSSIQVLTPGRLHNPESFLPYERDTLTPRIVHLGVSNFFTAHLATIVEDFNRHEATSDQVPTWGIAAVSMHSADKIQTLQNQSHLYTVGAVENETRSVTLVGSIVESVHSPSEPQRLTELLKKADLATFTITQGGYFVEGSAQEMKLRDCEEIQQDVATLKLRLQGTDFDAIRSGTGYRTALGPVVEAIAQRYRAGTPPLVVMSLDNTPPLLNGDILRFALSAMALQVEKQTKDESITGLSDYIVNQLPVLSTVVDRITPQQDSIDKFWMSNQFGFEDRLAVVTESHRCLKYEICDPAGHIAAGNVHIPELSLVDDVGQVENVEAYVLMKSRLINSLDVMAGQLGTRAGCATLGEFLKWPSFRALEDAMLTTELGRGIADLERSDVHCFSQEVQHRRENTFISGANTLSRLNNKGTVKMPSRVGAAIAALSHEAEAAKALTLTYACYLRTLLEQKDETGAPVDLQDDSPELVEQIRQTYSRASSQAASQFVRCAGTHSDDFPNRLREAQETAGINALLDQESWLFGTGSSSLDGSQVVVSELPSFRARLSEYFSALHANPRGELPGKVLKVSRTIVNPLECPSGYTAGLEDNH